MHSPFCFHDSDGFNAQIWQDFDHSLVGGIYENPLGCRDLSDEVVCLAPTLILGMCALVHTLACMYESVPERRWGKA